jgi:SPP1 family predicted phage head-tail adaptor
MKIGLLKHKICFLRLDESQNALGEVIPVEAEIAKVWASIEPVSGNERFMSNQIFAEATARIRCRFIEGITPKNVIRFKGRKYDILSVANKNERNIELDIIAKEAV